MTTGRGGPRDRRALRPTECDWRFPGGLSATSSRDKTLLIDQADGDTARLFGKRLADITKRWMTGPRA